MKVKVYYNLHKHCFSIVSLEKGENYGRVVAHRQVITLSDVTFKVSEAGRQRVLRENRKNVHAYVIGQLVENIELPQGNTVAITYNPYKFNSFVTLDGFTPVHQAKLTHLENRKIIAVL